MGGQEKRASRSGGAWTQGAVALRRLGGPRRISALESALDDLDLNEFGVAALEKTFDNSTVPHPGSITIGTGQWVGGLEGLSGPQLPWPRSVQPTWPVLQVEVCCRPLHLSTSLAPWAALPPSTLRPRPLQSACPHISCSSPRAT